MDHEHIEQTLDSAMNFSIKLIDFNGMLACLELSYT